MKAALMLPVCRAELVALGNALDEGLNGASAIAEWEFDSRIGCPRHDVEALHRRLRAMLSDSDG